MPLDNTLNVSELLRRLGVKGDSLGSAPLLESLRLSLNIGDLSALVPPIGVPVGNAGLASTGGVGTFNKWSLQSRAPGGLIVRTLAATAGTSFHVFASATQPFGATVLTASHNFVFGQTAESIFTSHTPAAKVAPPNSFQIVQAPVSLGFNFDNWIGPGEFFNIESRFSNVSEIISITWREYPGALNPG